ncbi:MAG: cardiolipin synthase [Planctomycetota bacterium]
MDSDFRTIWVALTLLHVAIQVILSVRVVMRRRPVGVTFAWLTIILAVPLLGALIYLFVGELRLGTRRAKAVSEIHGPLLTWLRNHSHWDEEAWRGLPDHRRDLARLAESATGLPPLAGNQLELLPGADDAFARLIADLDAARETIYLEFYIWHAGGWADRVAAALRRAAERGVRCYVLLDDVGSRTFLQSGQAEELRRAGVQVTAALPVSLMRTLFRRYDLRLHRKIVVIDQRIGYVGSLNLVDPRYFKTEAGVGQWIDALARICGPAVTALSVTFLEDWQVETGESVRSLGANLVDRAPASAGSAIVQVLPSGPAVEALTMQEVLLMAIYAARHEITLTSPYFVPEETLQAALIGAARRGVRVRLIVPAKEDSILVRFASQAYRGDLAAAGVEVLEFSGGLLHTKSVMIDGELSLFGSLNLDPRSFFLNFEVTVAVYDLLFATELGKLQESYAVSCQPLDHAEWQSRSAVRKFAQNVARLVGPLL